MSEYEKTVPTWPTGHAVRALGRRRHRRCRRMAAHAREAQHARKDAFHDHLHPGRVRVQAVRLVESGHGGHAVEQERIEERPVPFREFGVDRVEARAIFRSEVSRGQHPGEEHRQAAFGQRGQQTIQIRAGGRRVDRPQGVVGPECHDHRVGAIGQRPFEPCQSAGSRVAGDAGVDDADIEAAFAQRRLQPGGQGVAQGESVSRGEAVSEHQDTERFSAGLRCGFGRGQRKARQQPRPHGTRDPANRPRRRCGLAPLPAGALEAHTVFSHLVHRRVH